MKRIIRKDTKGTIKKHKWKSRKKDKPTWRNKEGGVIKPKFKYCKKCKKRKVKYHHAYCPKCWLENRNKIEVLVNWKEK